MINNKFYVSNTTTIIFSNASGRNSSEILKNKEISDINIMLYPNPSSSVVNIESEHDLSSFNAKIIDVTGRLILKNNYELSGYSTQLNISDLPTGIYTIIIENGQDKIIKKLIKK
ncbi:T9SS type A sorting domain-containing protein [Flavobacterium lindanitolerans]|nr:T9SS type A sorting domain-containing protein [Flavobacterium lindanitolerans]